MRDPPTAPSPLLDSCPIALIMGWHIWPLDHTQSCTILSPTDPVTVPSTLFLSPIRCWVTDEVKPPASPLLLCPAVKCLLQSGVSLDTGKRWGGLCDCDPGFSKNTGGEGNRHMGSSAPNSCMESDHLRERSDRISLQVAGRYPPHYKNCCSAATSAAGRLDTQQWHRHNRSPCCRG